jgi:hypothetical protein
VPPSSPGAPPCVTWGMNRCPPSLLAARSIRGRTLIPETQRQHFTLHVSFLPRKCPSCAELGIVWANVCKREQEPTEPGDACRGETHAPNSDSLGCRSIHSSSMRPRRADSSSPCRPNTYTQHAHNTHCQLCTELGRSNASVRALKHGCKVGTHTCCRGKAASSSMTLL